MVLISVQHNRAISLLHSQGVNSNDSIDDIDPEHEHYESIVNVLKFVATANYLMKSLKVISKEIEYLANDIVECQVTYEQFDLILLGLSEQITGLTNKNDL